MQQIRYVIPVPRARRIQQETIAQTAKRLEDDMGRVEAIRTALMRMKVHESRKQTSLDRLDAERDGARRARNAKASVETYNRWRQVIVVLMGRLTKAERATLGLRPRPTV